jgi:hypothetical protein
VLGGSVRALCFTAAAAIAAPVLGGPESVRVVCFTAAAFSSASLHKPFPKWQKLCLHHLRP